jgi:hypothetical protein
VAIMTGAAEPGAVGADQILKEARRGDVAHAAQALKSTKDE